MARIRTIKPEFFRHEKLQELQIEEPLLYPLVVFSALWGHCDKNGVFEWKPRILQLDILPFVWEATGKQLGASLMLLVSSQFITILTDGKKVYGYIPTFKEHQRINGKEAQSKALFPDPSEMSQFVPVEKEEEKQSEALVKHQGSTREAIETTGREGKGREGKGKELLKPESLSGKPSSIPYQEILDNMNRILNTSFKNTESFKKKIRGRINDGFSLEDFALVCEKKKKDWGSDVKMMQYLRPDTLFSEKMNSYLGGKASGRPVSERERINTAACEGFLAEEEKW